MCDVETRNRIMRTTKTNKAKLTDDDWGGRGNKDIYKKNLLEVERDTPPTLQCCHFLMMPTFPASSGSRWLPSQSNKAKISKE